MYLLKSSSRHDLQALTDCHKACFPKSLTTKLGQKYIKKTLEWFIVDDNRFLFHVVDENQIVAGYGGAFISQYDGDGSTSGMMRYAMAEGFKGIAKKPWLLFNKEVTAFYPLIFKNIIKKYFTSKQKAEKKAVLKIEKIFGLVVLGVRPAYQGTGVIEMLMKYCDDEAFARNISTLTLSVRTSNARAIGAYKKTGWKVVKQNETAISMKKNISLR